MPDLSARIWDAARAAGGALALALHRAARSRIGAARAAVRRLRRGGARALRAAGASGSRSVLLVTAACAALLASSAPTSATSRASARWLGACGVAVAGIASARSRSPRRCSRSCCASCRRARSRSRVVVLGLGVRARRQPRPARLRRLAAGGARRSRCAALARAGRCGAASTRRSRAARRALASASDRARSTQPRSATSARRRCSRRSAPSCCSALAPLALAGFLDAARQRRVVHRARYLVAKRRQTFISVITGICVAGVAAGVWLIITVLSVMNGFERTWREEIIGNRAHFTVHRAGSAPIGDYAGGARARARACRT